MTSTKHAFGRRHILTFVGLGTMTVMLSLPALAKELERKPNILFIFSDDLSYRDLSSS